MHRSLLVVAALFASTAQAGLYQCVRDGKTSFQDAPCAADSAVAKTITTAASAPKSIEWAGLRYDMTVDEVRQKIPAAEARSGGRVASGAVQQLYIGKVMVAGIPFEASFYFEEGRFRQVNLSGPMLTANEQNLRDFEKVSEEFRGKYGAEASRKVVNERWGISADSEWSEPNGKVWATITPVTGDTSMLGVGYRASR